MSASHGELIVDIVDDEGPLRDGLAFLFASRGIATRCWHAGEEFLAAWPQPDCGCIILDVRMEGMSGPQVFDALIAHAPGPAGLPPVIFLTGHADVPLAVRSLKGGAFDFVEKPFNDNQIVDLAQRAIDLQRARAERASRFASLSAREMEVMQLMLAGELNKQIADRLGIAMRTVEVHRARVLQKLGARNIADLARIATREG